MTYDVILAMVDTESKNNRTSFPRPVVEEYLNSDRCKIRLRDRTMLGALTHKYRYGAEKTEGLGADDRLLEDGIILFCITKLWIEGNNLMATIEVFDDLDDYSQDQIGHIKQLLRLLKHKVNVPISIVTDAEWNDDETEMTYLYDIIGGDVTLNPAFSGAKFLTNYETN